MVRSPSNLALRRKATLRRRAQPDGGAMEDSDTFKASFWNRDSDVGVQPPLTDEMLRTAERVLAVRLPESLVELLRVENGGIVNDEFNAFPSPRPTSWAEDHLPFAEVMGIGHAHQDDVRRGSRYSHRGILDTPYLIQEWEMPNGLVPLSGDGHSWICLDLSRARHRRRTDRNLVRQRAGRGD